MKKNCTRFFLITLAILTASALFACTGGSSPQVDGNISTQAPASPDASSSPFADNVSTPPPESTNIPQDFEILDYDACAETLLTTGVGNFSGELGYSYEPTSNTMRGPRAFSISGEYIAINDFYNQRIQVYQNSKFKYTIKASGREYYTLYDCCIVGDKIVAFESTDLTHYFPVYDLRTGRFIREIDTSSISDEDGISEILLDTLDEMFVRDGKLVIQCDKIDFTATDEWVIDPETDAISHNEIESFGGGYSLIDDELGGGVYENSEQSNFYLWHDENYLYTLVDLYGEDAAGKSCITALELRKYNRDGKLISKIPLDWYETAVVLVSRRDIQFIDGAFYCILSRLHNVEIVRIEF